MISCAWPGEGGKFTLCLFVLVFIGIVTSMTRPNVSTRLRMSSFVLSLAMLLMKALRLNLLRATASLGVLRSKGFVPSFTEGFWAFSSNLITTPGVSDLAWNAASVLRCSFLLSSITGSDLGNSEEVNSCCPAEEKLLQRKHDWGQNWKSPTWTEIDKTTHGMSVSSVTVDPL